MDIFAHEPNVEMDLSKQAIGILGGTFDPIHLGHLRIGLEVMQDLQLNEIRYIPARIPPHREQPVASPEQRVAMLKLALAEQNRFQLDLREMQREGPSYMVETLESLRSQFFHAPLCLILGTDAFYGLNRWHRWQELFDLAHIVVARRPVELEPAPIELDKIIEQRQTANARDLHHSLNGHIFFHTVSQLEISASAIRDGISRGLSARYLVADTVWKKIKTDGLYRGI